jgi:hypothetical protein
MKCAICGKEITECIIRTDPKKDQRPCCFNCAGIKSPESLFTAQILPHYTPVNDPHTCIRHNHELVWSIILKQYVCVDCIIESSERETGKLRRLEQEFERYRQR